MNQLPIHKQLLFYRRRRQTLTFWQYTTGIAVILHLSLSPISLKFVEAIGITMLAIVHNQHKPWSAIQILENVHILINVLNRLPYRAHLSKNGKAGKKSDKRERKEEEQESKSKRTKPRVILAFWCAVLQKISYTKNQGLFRPAKTSCFTKFSDVNRHYFSGIVNPQRTCAGGLQYFVWVCVCASTVYAVAEANSCSWVCGVVQLLRTVFLPQACNLWLSAREWSEVRNINPHKYPARTFLPLSCGIFALSLKTLGVTDGSEDAGLDLAPKYRIIQPVCTAWTGNWNFSRRRGGLVWWWLASRRQSGLRVMFGLPMAIYCFTPGALFQGRVILRWDKRVWAFCWTRMQRWPVGRPSALGLWWRDWRRYGVGRDNLELRGRQATSTCQWCVHTPRQPRLPQE